MRGELGPERSRRGAVRQAPDTCDIGQASRLRQCRRNSRSRRPDATLGDRRAPTLSHRQGGAATGTASRLPELALIVDDHPLFEQLDPAGDFLGAGILHARRIEEIERALIVLAAQQSHEPLAIDASALAEGELRRVWPSAAPKHRLAFRAQPLFGPSFSAQVSVRVGRTRAVEGYPARAGPKYDSRNPDTVI